jgi:NAD(P)H-nitrite reductase large subunit
MKYEYVIIGNSAAAIGAVEAIRKNDRNGRIAIISSENYHVYSRPLISYLLLKKTNEEKMKYRDDSFYSHHGCELKLNKTAIRINPEKKLVILDDGSDIGYDKLLISTGSSPLIPPIPGLDQVKYKFAFTTLDDAKALENVLKENLRVLIIGAGLIGLKCAEGIRNKGVEIICVDLSPRVLSSILDDESSEIVKKHLEEKNIKLYLGRRIKKIKKNAACFDDGSIIQFDVLVMAAGVKPNISLIRDAGGKTNMGIIINERCQTSIPDIYAAGDCCESIDISSGETKLMALLPNAYMQGECAGMNMSGADYIFDKAVPMNSIDLFGKHIMTAGTYSGRVYYESDGKNYKKLFYSENRLNGFILIDNIEKAGIYTALIRERTPLDTLDFELICKMPGLMAFDREARAEMLGGKDNESART